MKWLHISDLHISKCTDWELMKQSYKKTLGDSGVEFILITGDLHQYQEDYLETEKFLNVLLSATKLNKDKLYIVPGNHDAENFDNKAPFLEYIIKHSGENEDVINQYLDILSQSYKKYNEFYARYFQLKEYKLNNVELCIFEDKINIIKINTSLISDGNRTHPEMLDCLSLSKISINNNLPTIAMGHHSISSLSEAQQNQVKRIFTNLNVSAYLCGDMHKTSTKQIEIFTCSNQSIPCITCGKSSINSGDDCCDNSYIIYDLDNNGVVNVNLFEWDDNKKTFLSSSKLHNDDQKCQFPLKKADYISTTNSILPAFREENIETDLNLKGYVLIGPRGNNGIKYIWEKGDMIVESIAFNNRLNAMDISKEDSNTSAYTCSISHGCILNSSNQQCLFCESGKNFNGYLTSEDIALQNIFMAEYDSDCKSYPVVKSHKREFAFMGQGEPGYVYPLIRKSILLTDYAMEEINQEVSRYIISTCGISDFIPLLTNDIKSNVYKNKVTLHFSLNAVGKYRDKLMPINLSYHYNDFIKECKSLFNATNEKIAISIIIFNNLILQGRQEEKYTLNGDVLKSILSELDPNIFRIDLRDFNGNSIMNLRDVSNEYAQDLLNICKEYGFDSKLFSCFGKSEGAALGTLNSSNIGISIPGQTTLAHHQKAKELLNFAKEKYLRGTHGK